MHSEKEIIQGINNLLHELNSQKPKSVVILHGIFPQGELSSDPVRAKLLKINPIPYKRFKIKIFALLTLLVIS